MSDRLEERIKRYRRLLKLFPSDFVERFGADMEAVGRFRLEAPAGDASKERRVWRGLVFDTVRGAVAEWFRWGGRSLIGLSLGGVGMGSVGRDLRQAFRSLRRAPGATAIAIGTLAIGIGAITTTFSVVDGVMLEPLPYDQPERIVSVWPAANFNTALVREVDEAVPALESVAGYSGWTAVLGEEGSPEEIEVARVSPSFFSILGIDPAMGRTLAPDEDLAGNTAVVVLSHALWSTRFGSDPEIVGRTIRLNLDGIESHTVVGVMPEGFAPPGDAMAWTPLIDDRALGVSDDSSWYVNSRIARLAAGATKAQADQQLSAYAARVAPLVPNQFGPEQLASAVVVPLKDNLIEDARAALWILLGAVGLVLVIACANVANLLLARGEARRHTLAIRASLGASRAGIIRLLLAETLVLGGIGGLLGVGTAILLVDVVTTLAPADIHRISQVDVDWRVLAFAFAVTLIATVASGLWPALRSSRDGILTELSGSSRGSSGRGRSRVVSHALIGAEMALAVIVTLGSGLMLRSLDELMSVDIGFEPEGVVAFRPNPLGSGREGAQAFRQFYGDLIEQVAAAPGVQDVGAVQILTGTSNNWSFPTYPDDYEIPESGALPNVNFRAVTPGYFETLRVPLVRGRYVDAGDREGGEPVVVVNRAFVDEFWPDEDGLGKTLSIFGTEGTRYRVVGVVGDIRQHALSMDPLAEVYVPYMAWPWEMSAWILARTDTPEAFKADIRGIIDRVDPNVPVSGIDDLDRVMARSAAETRFFTVLLTSFGALGLLLGAIGIYGVTSYTVVRRRAEFGVRRALGATRIQVITSALRQGITPIVIGAVAGIVVGLAGGRVLQSYLYRIEPFDPPTLIAVALTLTIVAALALTVPAWRAGRVDPVEVLSSG